MRKLFIVLLALAATAANAAQQLTPEKLLVQETSGGTIRIDQNLVRKADPAVTARVIAENKKSDGLIEMEYPFDLKLSADDKLFFHVFCTGGMSGDPECLLVDARCAWGDTKNCSLISSGQNLNIPGDGCIYQYGTSDDYFNRHDRVCLQNKKFVKAPQPFYAVGLKSLAQHPINLFADKQLSSPMGNIAVGEAVEVILADTSVTPSESTHVYLLKDNEGIVGWARIAEGTLSDEGDIKGLLYHGD